MDITHIDNKPQLLNERMVAEEYGLSVSWQRKKRRMGEGLPYLKIGRLVRYRREHIEMFLRSCMVGEMKLGKVSTRRHGPSHTSCGETRVET